MSRGRRPKSPVTQWPQVDFLFRLFALENVPDYVLARSLSTSNRLVSAVRHGAHKRIINPLLAQLAARFGYKFALVPAEYPDIVLRPEHTGLPAATERSIQIETERLSHAAFSQASPATVGTQQDHAARH